MSPEESTEAEPRLELWVVEATVDVPAKFEPSNGSSFVGFWVSLGGHDADGFVELAPLDVNRSMGNVWWSLSEPVVLRARGLVRASDPAGALLRGQQLYEHLADRLMLVTGYPTRVLSIGTVYSDGQLSDCLGGKRDTYEMTMGGTETVRTQLPKNFSHQSLFVPPADAHEAIRWFRTAMTASRRVDQFVAYYFALESIADFVPGIQQAPRHCACGKEIGIETKANAGIKYLIGLHPDLPKETRRLLATTRARVVHGSADAAVLANASANLPLVQRLAADGIALVCGLKIEQLQFLAPNPVHFMAPLGQAKFSATENPLVGWGGLLSDRFSMYLEQSEGASPPTA